MAAVEKMTPRAPDFLCIGAQKAGTTWLHENLRRHPGLWMPPVKELQYFNQIHIPGHRAWTQRHRDDHAIRSLKDHVGGSEPPDLRHIRLLAQITDPAVDDDWYRSIFAYAPPDRLCGEMTPEYSTLPDEGIGHLLSVAPDARAIFIMRDPIDRCWSHIRMIHRNSSGQDADLDRIARMDDIYARTDYPALIARWQARIGENHLHLGFFDDIRSEPRAFLKGVLGFLGLKFDPEMFPDLKKVVHKGKPLDIPGEIETYMKERLAPVYDEMATLFPKPGGTWRKAHY